MFFSRLRQPKIRQPLGKRTTRPLRVEQLEDRQVPTTFNVLNLGNSGAGSLRQAIIDANHHTGADVIHFNVSGTIQLANVALPTVTGPVNIDGSSAPGFAGVPVIEVDYNHFGGLLFNSSSGGSTLRSLALVNANGAGVTLDGGGGNFILGNYIGLDLNGTTPKGNSGSGLLLLSSSGNVIGGATVQDRNVISSNGHNGIALGASSNNKVMGNYIGTDVTGTLSRGNGGNGIVLTTRSTGNTIGGQTTGGNDPTNGVFVTPPQGNLISGNYGNGVLINGLATQNLLSGNFIGTTFSGNTALGNTLDGVAIENANGNALVGCALTTNPFVFYNVISGNGGNGLRVTSSNNTTIQGNFFGLGADNQTAVGNHLNGVLVEGTSKTTIMGGPIPLGNVDAANGLNGILVRGTASFFLSYNTFCGLAAFQQYTNLGNGWDGIRITSTGGNNLLRTNVIAENANDGIEITGAATGVRIAGNIIGLDTQGNAEMGNKNHGIEVSGTAHNILIGGPQATFNIIPHNVISGNGGNGVAFTGNAYNISLNFSFIGTDLDGLDALGNVKSGVFAGPGTHGIAIGSADPNRFSVISGNGGDGIEMRSTYNDAVIGCLIGTDVLGLGALPNSGDGIYMENSFNNTIGRTTAYNNAFSADIANLIAFNAGHGVVVASGAGNAIGNNSIYGNSLSGIDIAPGANRNQAAPVLASVHRLPLSTEVSGTLSGTPNTNFTVEFFVNDTSAASGRTSVGFQAVRTNASGVGTFTFFGPVLSAGTHYFTATVTDSKNDTSAFSIAAAVI